jgi:hypothetical protein
MPPTTTADRNRVERSFRKQHDRVSEDKDAVMAADEGPARKQAIVQLLKSLVSFLTIHRFRRADLNDIQTDLDKAFDRMDRFPSGGWDLDGYDTFNEWARDLKTIDPSKSLQTAILALMALGIRFEKATTPEEVEDEASDDDEVPATIVPPSQSRIVLPSSRVKPRRAAGSAQGYTTTEIADKEPGTTLLVNEPKVSTSTLSHHFLFIVSLL